MALGNMCLPAWDSWISVVTACNSEPFLLQKEPKAPSLRVLPQHTQCPQGWENNFFNSKYNTGKAIFVLSFSFKTVQVTFYFLQLE